MGTEPNTSTSASETYSATEVFFTFLRLGLTSFGGPLAHLGFFREEFVVKKKWLSEDSYADLVALCQFLPGPASSQVGIAIGLSRAGYSGALCAWAGFTLPSAILLVLFALGISSLGDAFPPSALHGLKVVAVAVVAQALWGMAKTLCTDALRVSFMVTAACIVLAVPSAWSQVAVIVSAGVAGRLLFSAAQSSSDHLLPTRLNRRIGFFWLTIFVATFFLLPVLKAAIPNQLIALADAFFRAGSLVFGGGHVVLPLLQSEVVATGWISNEVFLAGYAAAQAVPGPLFTFAAYLGASLSGTASGWLGGVIGLVAIFAPSFFLVLGGLPIWESLKSNKSARSSLAGINAAVVGLLLAAFYNPVWKSAIHGPKDFGLALLALVGLMFWKLPAWFVVISSGILGWVLCG